MHWAGCSFVSSAERGRPLYSPRSARRGGWGHRTAFAEPWASRGCWRRWKLTHCCRSNS